MAIATLAALAPLTACDGAEDDADASGAAVAAGGGNADLEFDSSTMDAMSIDVAAGGVESPLDPETADAGLEMLNRQTNGSADTSAAADAEALAEDMGIDDGDNPNQ
ncbi:MAG: hypothetical protein WA906_09065 [Pacificimonas sp.]